MAALLQMHKLSRLEQYVQELASSEYEVQHFEFTFCSLIFAVSNAIQDSVENSVKTMQTVVLKNVGKHMTEEVEDATHNIIDSYLTCAADSLKKLEVYLKANLFNIPDNVLLPEDKPNKHQYTPEEVSKLDEEIKELENRIMEATFITDCCEKELEDTEKTLEAQSTLLKQKEFLDVDVKVSDVLHTMLNEMQSFKWEQNKCLPSRKRLMERNEIILKKRLKLG